MKIKIALTGTLYIERGSRGMVIQSCPYTYSVGTSLAGKACGDWCPLFGNVQSSDEFAAFLSLCRRVLTFSPDDYEDER